MGEPYFHFPSEIACPFCGEPEQQLEDLGDTPFYLSSDCSSCEKNFAYDVGRHEFYDDNGNIIKPITEILPEKRNK